MSLLQDRTSEPRVKVALGSLARGLGVHKEYVCMCVCICVCVAGCTTFSVFVHILFFHPNTSFFFHNTSSHTTHNNSAHHNASAPSVHAGQFFSSFCSFAISSCFNISFLIYVNKLNSSATSALQFMFTCYSCLPRGGRGPAQPPS